jgi:hypothetical protein
MSMPTWPTLRLRFDRRSLRLIHKVRESVINLLLGLGDVTSHKVLNFDRQAQF